MEVMRTRSGATGEDTKICVTGAQGYIASHVVEQSLGKGWHVNGTSREPSTVHFETMPGVERLTLFKANLREPSTFEMAVSRDLFEHAVPDVCLSVSRLFVRLSPRCRDDTRRFDCRGRRGVHRGASE